MSHSQEIVDLCLLERLLEAKYNWLLKWALHFAEGDLAMAEDMAQDTIVRFYRVQPSLDKAENIEALLYAFLKYVHYEHLRRRRGYPLKQISLAEYDSLRLSLRGSATADQVTVQNSLRRIANYLNWRKETAKSASLLILRYFHGYYPDEIMQISRLGRAAVDKGIFQARDEAKLYVSAPEQMRSAHQSEPPEAISMQTILPPEQLSAELLRTIFSACRTECLPHEALRGHYLSGDAASIDRELLAHIVSCRDCLEIARNCCHIEPPSNDASIGLFDSDRGSRRRAKPMNSSFDSAHPLAETLRAVYASLREVYEHHPRQLSVVVNGEVVVCQDVGSDWMRLDLKLNAEPKPEVIEMFSEQGVCLLALYVGAAPPEGEPEIHQQAIFSGGRVIDAVLKCTSLGLYFNVSYRDTVSDESKGSCAESTESQNGFGSAPPSCAWQPKATLRSWRTRLRLKLHAWAAMLRRPQFAAALAIFVVAAAIGTYWISMALRPSVHDELASALAADQKEKDAGRPGVAYQNLRIRVGNQVMSRTILRDVQQRRVLKPRLLSPEETTMQRQLAVVGVNWEEPLGAGNYLQWHDDQSIASESERASGDLITLITNLADGPILRESFTIRASDHHPVQRTIEMRAGESIEIAELGYRVEPWSAPTELLFGPPPPGCNCGELSPRTPAAELPRGVGVGMVRALMLARASLPWRCVADDPHAAVALLEGRSRPSRTWRNG